MAGNADTTGLDNRKRTLFIEWEGRTLTAAQAEEISGVPAGTLHYRIKAGWSVEKAMTTPVAKYAKPKHKRVVRVRKGASVEPFGPENEEKFWSYLKDCLDPAVCWEWPGTIDERFGKPVLNLIGGKTIGADRFAATIKIRPSLKGELVFHTCGSSTCVNPDHLAWGTRQQLAKDLIRTGKNTIPSTAAQDNPAARLTEEQVLYIRQSERTGQALSEFLGVAATTISMAQLGKTWTHLPGARTRRRVGHPNGGDYIEL